MADLDDALDLTCEEVIIEDLIEPHQKEASHSEELQNVPSHVRLGKLSNLSFEGTSASGGPSSTGLESAPTGVPKQRKRKRARGSMSSSRRKRVPVPAPDKVGGDEGAATEVNGEEYDDPIHTVLPIEIRWRIFRELSTPELLQFRSISRQWKGTVDSVLKLHVKIDGDSRDFKGRCGLPMKSCTLANFQNPSHRQLFKSVPPPDDLRVTLGICYLNFEEMVLQWSHLTRLELCWRSIMKNLLFGRSAMDCSPALKKPEIFPNLACLRVEVLIQDGLGQRTKSRIVSNLNNLTSYNYPCLAHFTMVFVGYRELHAENRHMSVLLPFLNRHATSLDTIDFTLKYASHILYPPAHPRHILFCVPANLKNSRKTYYSAVDTHLVTTELKKSSHNPEDHQDWIRMLSDTRKLEIAIMTRFLSWSIKHLEYFTPTIHEYAKFLRVIELMNVTMYNSGAHNTVTQLDAKVFSPCHQLTELRIYRAPIIFHEDEMEPPTELNNLHELPISLEEITVDGLPVAATDILLTMKKLKNLRIFHYFQSQVPRRNMLASNGINWEALQAILQHQNLQFAKFHVSSQANTYHRELDQLSTEYGWSTTGITPGYMNMFQITLIK